MWIFTLFACATLGTFQRADTLNPGDWEVSGDASAILITDSSTTGITPIPVLRAGGRVGVAERVDVGGSFGTDGVRANAKIELTKGDGPIVSVSPGMRVLPLPFEGSTVTMVGFEEKLYFGLPLNAHQLVFSAGALEDLGIGEESTAMLVWASAGVGFSADLGNNLRLMPEVTAQSPLFVLDGDSASSPRGLITQGGVSLSFYK